MIDDSSTLFLWISGGVDLMDIGRSSRGVVTWISWKKLIAYEICFVVQVVRKRKENLLFVLSFIFFEVLCIINFL